MVSVTLSEWRRVYAQLKTAEKRWQKYLDRRPGQNGSDARAARIMNEIFYAQTREQHFRAKLDSIENELNPTQLEKVMRIKKS